MFGRIVSCGRPSLVIHALYTIYDIWAPVA